VSATISRNGDLINRIYLQATLPAVSVDSASFRWINDIGHHLVKNCEVDIGGQQIDKQYGDWLQIWDDLTQEAGKVVGYGKMIGQTTPTDESSLQFWGTDDKASTTLYIPLQFWFCRNVGLALPLIALQYHEVKVTVEFRALSECIITTAPSDFTSLSLSAASLYVDYIYLDTDERRRFAQVSHEYLIEQLQHTGEESVSNSSNKIRLSFNHPIKELVWTVQHEDHVATPSSANNYQGHQWSNYTTVTGDPDEDHQAPDGGDNPCNFAKLQLNGHDRFSTRFGPYFNLVQPHQHHTNIPTSPGINVYSFALKPEEHQPSGSANFSRIDNATLQLNVTFPNHNSIDAKVRVYAVNYNVLRIMSGINSTCAKQLTASSVPVMTDGDKQCNHWDSL